MSYATGTTHYNLPQTVGSDKRDWTDTNQAFSDLDTAVYGAAQGAEAATSAIQTINSELDVIAGKQATDEENITTLNGKVSTLEGTTSTLGAEVLDVRQDLQDNIESKHEASATSAHAYAIGDTFYYNDILYKATAAISIGDTIVPTVNCMGTTVMSEIQSGGSSDTESVRYDVKPNWIQVKHNDVWYDYAYFNPEAPTALVPTMTSNTTPSGEVIYSNDLYSGYNAYDAFNNAVKGWLSTGLFQAGSYVGYKFDTPTIVTKAEIKPLHITTYTGNITVKIQGSSNGASWTDLSSDIVVPQSLTDDATEINISQPASYQYYRVLVVSPDIEQTNGLKVQFYGH